VRRLPALDAATGEHPAGTHVRHADNQDASLVVGGKDVRAFRPPIPPTEQRAQLDSAGDEETRDVGQPDPAANAGRTRRFECGLRGRHWAAEDTGGLGRRSRR
jgi:hypothetical protein